MSRIKITGESADFFNTIEGRLFSSRFNCEIMLYGKRVGEYYLKKCAEYFENLPDDIFSALLEASAAYLNDLLEEHDGEYDVELPELTPGNVMTFLQPVELRAERHELLAEEDCPAAFSVKLEFAPVPDEMVEWTVRGEQPVYVGEYRGISPWNEKVARKKWNYAGGLT